VYREILKDGTTVIKSFKGDKLYKTITKRSGIYLKDPSISRTETCKRFYTEALNHETGKYNIIVRSQMSDGSKVWNSSVHNGVEDGRSIHNLLYYNSDGKIYNKIIEKYQSGPGYLSVRTRPGYSKPVEVIAHNYSMPNGKIVDGVWGKEGYSFALRKPYSINCDGKYYSGNRFDNMIFNESKIR
jgi:hypothetical protein